jgi:hypothetical protein
MGIILAEPDLDRNPGPADPDPYRYPFQQNEKLTFTFSTKSMRTTHNIEYIAHSEKIQVPLTGIRIDFKITVGKKLSGWNLLYLSIGLHKGLLRHRIILQSSKENIQQFKT